MGFYGRIANSNKTAFSFDRIYSNRRAMDIACSSDEVFIGRYVLVEYDEPPITGYYNAADGMFYNVLSWDPRARITPREGVIYQDLVKQGATSVFYYWDGTHYLAFTASVNSGYAGNYSIDVNYYGRGYDSTAWMKTFDVESGKYKYVLISELNTIVPTFHLVTDAPSDAPRAPYFDLATTTIDYYLHAQADWGQSIRIYNQGQLYNGDNAKDVIDVSDEAITYSQVIWNGDPNGVQYSTRIENASGQGDIYYNKAGFDPEQRTFATGDSEEASQHLSTIYHKDLTNTINYDMNYSGRKYNGSVLGNEWNTGAIAKDKIEWYVHLPVIGNTICQVWDRMYGYDTNGRRYTHLAMNRSDIDYKVTYDTTTALGCINKIRDVLGWVLLPKSATDNITPAQDGSIYTPELARTRYLYYTLKDPTETPGGVVTKEEQVIDKYYYFAYDPLYVIATPDQNDPEIWSYTSGGDTVTGTGADIFYLDTDGIYKHPQASIYRQVNSDGSFTDPKYNTFYLAYPRWKLVEFEEYNSDTLYGLIIQLHKLLGDYSLNIRDENSVIGLINIMKDIIDNIDRILKPHRLVFTNSDGQMTTKKSTYFHNNDIDVEIEFPYFASADKQELLDCYGTWRLPVTYKLEEYSSMNESFPVKWFDNGYYGNSLLHEIYATDTIGEALRKIENDIADSHYEKQEILSFTATAPNQGEANSDYQYVENGSTIRLARLNYTLNKGPRQSISIDRGATNVWSNTNIAPDYFVDDRVNYLLTAEGEQDDTTVFTWAAANADTDITWTLTVADERSQTATATTQIHYADKVYWFTGAYKYTAGDFDSLLSLNSFAGNSLHSQLTRKKISPTDHILVGTNKYFYYMFPSNLGDSEDFFEINGFRGGMDYIGHVNFTNGNNYTTSYKVWRSTNPNLGIITFKALREGEDV